MSYLVLARKSRPQTFEQVVGQRSVVKTLRNSIKRDRVAHAILFSGVRGVGKTTLARIMAKAVNCDGGTDNPPCGTCRPCKEIAAGSALDLIEIDGASNRGIQEIRELKEKIKFMPTSCRYKIIIIDEVHMLTTEAFNALLKTLEEPPEHVYFMFATTELHKIPITILSRCQQYELKRIPAQELADHFKRLAEGEKITIDQAALSLIVREAEGSVRDGLSLLDQVFSFGEEHITVNDVTELLGLVDRDLLMRLSVALLRGDRHGMFHTLDQLFGSGMDLKRFSTDLLDCFRTMLMTRIEGCGELVDLPAEELSRYAAAARDFTAQTLHLKLNLLMQMVEEIRHSSQPRLAIETGLLKVVEADNVIPVTDILAKLQTLLDSGKMPEPTAPEQLADKKKVEQPPEPSLTPPPAPAPPPREPFCEPAPPLAPDLPPSEPEPEEEPPPAEESPSPAAPQPVRAKFHEKDIRKDWPDFLAYVKERRVWMAQVLNRADSVKEVEGELQLHYEDPAECSLLRQKENRVELTEFFLDFFQKDLTIQFILPEDDGGTDTNGESPKQKRNQLLNDPLTVLTAEIFSGQVGSVRIGPRSR